MEALHLGWQILLFVVLRLGLYGTLALESQIRLPVLHQHWN